MIPKACRAYNSPRALAEALACLADPARRVLPLAGGTDLLVRLHRGLIPLGSWEFLSLRRIPELGGIAVENGFLRIGAGTTARELAASGLVRDQAPVLSYCADRMASAQIRSVATLGGNLANASPAADLALPLLVLDAEVEIARAGKGGAIEQRVVPATGFFTGPGATVLQQGELITAVRIPLPPAGTRMAAEKIGTRPAMDCAIASAAMALRVEGGRVSHVRVAFGSLAPVPLRGRATEAALLGRPSDEETFAAAATAARSEVSPISDVRASAAYRRELAESLIRRLIRACGG